MQARYSTRFWLITVGLVVTAAVEVAFHFGIEVRAETLHALQAGLTVLAGLDTARPLGAPQVVSGPPGPAQGRDEGATTP